MYNKEENKTKEKREEVIPKKNGAKELKDFKLIS